MEIERDENGRFLKGEKHPFYGKHRSKETCKKISESQKGKHPSEETRRKLSEAHKGHLAWNKGKTEVYSEETLRKMSENAIRHWKGKHLSDGHRKKMSDAQRGEKSYRWKGGNEAYQGPNDQYQSRLVRERDKGICQNCGKKEGARKHDIHHIVPFEVYGIEKYEEANRLENLMTLCRACHITCHNRIGKRIEE